MSTIQVFFVLAMYYVLKLFLLATLEKYTITIFLSNNPKLSITIVFSFSQDFESSQEKLKTMVMQNFGSEGEGEGGQKDYYGIVKVADGHSL